MIPPELVRVRRRGDRLELLRLDGALRDEAARIGADFLGLCAASLGLSGDEIEQALDQIPRSPRAEKLARALKKIVLDACEFEAQADLDPKQLRRELFTVAAAVRREAAQRAFERADIVQGVAAKFELSPEVLESLLFSDLRGAARLRAAASLSAPELLERYEQASLQGVLLRATQLTLEVSSPDAAAQRRLFQKLKFRRLLHRIERQGAGRFRIEVDGPLSLFESVTKYGVQLAQLVPVLADVGEVELSAELRWGKERRPLVFHASFSGRAAGGAPEWRGDLAELAAGIERSGRGFRTELCEELFDLPGVGVLVPDLRLTAQDGRSVYVEVLGFWSREAVFRRLDWARAEAERGGTRTKILFAVSSQLRVSEELTREDESISLYVYKGVMNAKALLDRVEALLAA